MNKDYFTVENISEMLNIHPKTIQRYIREGKLRAVKVGKGWRVSGHDLSVFLESADPGISDPKTERTIKVSSVIDMETRDSEDAIRIMNMLTSALHAKPSEFSKASMQLQYIESEKLVRAMLWGDINFMSAIMDMIIVITK